MIPRITAADAREDNREIHYEHNVLAFPSPHARANAAQAALSTEEDRADLRKRRLEVVRLIQQLRLEIFDLETEYDMLGGGMR